MTDRTNSDTTLMTAALTALEELLPPQWQVERAQGPAQGKDLVDEHFYVKDRSGSGRALLVDARPQTTPAELERSYTSSLARRIRADAGSPILVIAPYLSPRSRTVLEKAEINYLDLTGNARIAIDYPGLSILTQGAQRDPTPRKRPDRGIAGPVAGRIVRTLADVEPPYSVKDIAALADVSPGYCSRTLQALEREALVRRNSRGTVEEVDWPALLRRRGSAVPLFDPRRTKAYIARSGTRRVLETLAAGDDAGYAVTGSFAAARIRAVTAPVGLTVYSVQPDGIADTLGLLSAEEGSDVRLVLPADEGVFDRSTVVDGIRWVAPSQIVVDCLGGSGRMPQEGDAVLEWMIEHENEWRVPAAEAAI